MKNQRKREIEKPIFIIGMPRSGTTVISEAVALHEDLGWFSNLMAYSPGSCWLSAISRLADIPSVGSMVRGKKMQSRGLGARVRNYLPHFTEAYSIWAYYCGKKFQEDYLIDQVASGQEMERISHAIKKVMAYQGKKRFIAKLTGPPRIHYLNSMFPDAYFVHILRDPRAVVSSLLNVGFWKKAGLERPWWKNGLPDACIEEWINNNRSPVALAAVQWKWIIELTWREKEIIGNDRFIEIKYEDFINDSHLAARELFHRLNLADSRKAHHFLDTTGRAYNTNHKYKEIIKKSDIKMIEDLTRSTALKAGYYFECSTKNEKQ